MRKDRKDPVARPGGEGGWARQKALKLAAGAAGAIRIVSQPARRIPIVPRAVFGRKPQVQNDKKRGDGWQGEKNNDERGKGKSYYPEENERGGKRGGQKTSPPRERRKTGCARVREGARKSTRIFSIAALRSKTPKKTRFGQQHL